MNEEKPNPHKEAQMHLLGANLLYLTLAQLASPSIRVRNDDIECGKEDT